MGNWIAFPSEQQTLKIYQSEPASVLHNPAGILVLHAWWGLNEFIQQLCDRLAAQGFAAAAPDLYHGQTADTINEAKKLRNGLDREAAQRDILTALDYLQRLPGNQHRPVGMIGFSLGAYLGMGTVEARPEAFAGVVLFYGGRKTRIKRAKAAFQLHFAETDPYATADDLQRQAENIRNAKLELQVYQYPGTEHWFFENNRADAYQPEAAQLAWERTVSFLKAKLKA